MSDSTAVDSQRGAGLMSMIKALVGVALIIVIECVAAAKLLPTPERTAEVGRKLAAAAAGTSDDEAPLTDESGEPVLVEDVVEVSLGDFHVTAFQPSSNMSLSITLELFGTVLAEEEAEFLDLFSANEHRFREQVVVTLRGAEVTDLTDAGLGLIKRQILEKSNRTLGKPILQQIIFSQFSFVER